MTLASSCKTKKAIEVKVEEDLGMDTKEIGGIKLFTSLSGVSPKMKNELDEKNIKRAILVNGKAIDNPNSLIVDKEKIKTHFDKILPNPQSNAIIVLDIEGKKMVDMHRTKAKKEYDSILNYYIDVFKYAKKLRPKATIGFYGFPWRDYWNRTEQWRIKNDALLPLIKEVDALFPSIYDFYADGIDVKKAMDEAYISDNVKESIRLAKQFDKLVFPFIWHRYHNSNKKRGLQFIDVSEFSNHVRTICQTEFEGNKVNGIIWWSSERYFYNVSPRGKKNKYSQSDFEKYSDNTSFKYIDAALKGMKSAITNH